MDYVLGFLFNPELDMVVLIEKQKPAWQKGRFNGVGGKVEPGENAYQAMVREFQEEAGITLLGWKHFGHMGSKSGKYWRVHLFVAASPKIVEVRSLTEEAVVTVSPGMLPLKAISNIEWLVPLAKNFLTHPELAKIVIDYDASAKTSHIVDPFDLPTSA